MILVRHAGMDSEENRKELAAWLGRYVLAVPTGRLKEVREQMLTRPGRFKRITDNLGANKEVVDGDGEARRRYLVCRNREEERCQRRRREKLLLELAEELASLGRVSTRTEHVRRACGVMASRRYGR